MAYRKIDPRIWNDEKFRDLSDKAKLAFIFLLSHPSMTPIGAMRASIPGLASELGWQEKAFREAFGEVLAKGIVKADERASCVYLPNYLKYNGPESPNVVISWGKCLDWIPECALKVFAIERVKGFAEALPEAFSKALPEAFAKSMPKQELRAKSYEQELEQVKEPRPVSAEASELATLLKDCILKNNPSVTVTVNQTNTWGRDADLILRRDKRGFGQAKALLLWSQSNSFWWKNILSMGTLRKQWDKLFVQMEAENGRAGPQGKRAGNPTLYSFEAGQGGPTPNGGTDYAAILRARAKKMPGV